jgi:hypothetical protein
MKLLVTAIKAKPIGSSTGNGYFPVNRYKLWNICCNNQPGPGTRRNLAKKLSLGTEKKAPGQLIKRRLIDRRLIDRRLINRQLINRQLIDRRLIDRQLIDTQIDRHTD